MNKRDEEIDKAIEDQNWTRLAGAIILLTDEDMKTSLLIKKISSIIEDVYQSGYTQGYVERSS